MIVVADTSPINYLVLIGHIEILNEIYGEVLIPEAVYDELRDGSAPSAVRNWLLAAHPWLQVRQVTSDHEETGLAILDPGERDAILLAQSLHADRLVINRGVPVIGTLGVLADASGRGLLELPKPLAALQKTNFHAAPELIRRLLSNDAKGHQ